MNTLNAALIAILIGSQPLAAFAQAAQQHATPPPHKKDPPLVYGPKLYETPEQQAAAMRAVAKRNKREAQKDPVKRKLAPRRPTRQVLITMPPSPSSTSGYVPMPVPMPNPGVTPVVPAPPAPVTCVGATCTGAGGLVLPPPVGNTTIDGHGRQCVQNGNFVQCF